MATNTHDIERAASFSSISEASPLLSRVDSTDDYQGKSPSSVSNARTASRLPDEQDVKPAKGVVAIISLLLIGVFMSNADSTLVMTTYTTISSEFNAFNNAAWLTTSYTLAAAAFQPILGKLSDIYGRKAVLVVSYAIFAIGSVLT